MNLLATIENGLPTYLKDLDPAYYYRPGKVVVVDYETTTKLYGDAGDTDNHIVLAVWRIYDNLTGSLISEHHKFGDEYDQYQLIEDLNSCLYFVAQNAKFEYGWHKRAGADIGNLFAWDTMLYRKVELGNLPGQLDLNSLAKHEGLGAQKEDYVSRLIKQGADIYDIPPSMLLRYCRQDVALTARIWRAQWSRARATTLLPTFYTRMLLTPVLADMEFNGMALDADAVRAEYSHQQAKLDELSARMNELTGGINWKSSDQVANYVYNTLKFTVPTDGRGNPKLGSPSKTFPLGKPSVNAKVLEGLKAKTKKQTEFLALKKELGRVEALLSKALRPFIEIIEQGGIVRFNYNQHVTATHRLSSNGKTASIQGQNIPREYKPMFKARHPGWLLGETDYCLVPGTRVLTSELKWKPIEDVQIGEELVGFDEALGRNTKTAPSIVEKTKRLSKETIRIVTDRGVIEGSTDHMLVGRRLSPGGQLATRQWYRMDELKVGDALPYFVKPWEQATAFEDGWMSGILDGEGYLGNNGVLGVAQNQGLVLDRMMKYFDDAGISVVRDKADYKCVKLRVTGEAFAGLRVIGRLQPMRLKRKMVDKLRQGATMHGKLSRPARILSIERTGRKEVIALQTSTKTFIAEGFWSHNCKLEYVTAAFLGNDPQAIKDVMDDFDVHKYSAAVMKVAATFDDPANHIQTILELAQAAMKDVTKQERAAAKPDTFGPLYGKVKGSPAQEAYFTAFKHKYAKLNSEQERWIDKVLNSEDKSLQLCTGMIFYYPYAKMTRSGYVEQSTNIRNHSIQSFATAEVVPVGVVYTWHAMRVLGLKSFLNNTIHDSIETEVHPDEKEIIKQLHPITLVQMVLRYLTRVYKIDFNVPLEVEIGFGTHWGKPSEEHKAGREFFNQEVTNV